MDQRGLIERGEVGRGRLGERDQRRDEAAVDVGEPTELPQRGEERRDGFAAGDEELRRVGEGKEVDRCLGLVQGLEHERKLADGAAPLGLRQRRPAAGEHTPGPAAQHEPVEA